MSEQSAQDSPFDLSSQTALVTGAGRGIGRELALGLARAGANLLLLGRPGSCLETAEAVTALGRKVVVLDVDLSDVTTLDERAKDIARDHHVDILVNNAGIIDRTPAVDVDLEKWHEVTAIDLDAVFILSRHFGAQMIEHGHGKIINIASLLSFQGGINVVSYTTSKHGVLGMTRALANEWAPKGVQVNAIAPGYVITDNTAALRRDEDRAADILSRIPAGRWATPSDLVGAAVFLASSASDYINGHTLVVDGGWMAR